MTRSFWQARLVLLLAAALVIFLDGCEWIKEEKQREERVVRKAEEPSLPVAEKEKKVPLEEILTIYKEVIEEFPKHPESDEVFGLIVNSYRRSPEESEEVIYQRILLNHLNGRIGLFALSKLSRLSRKKNRDEGGEFQNFCQKLYQEHPDTPVGAMAFDIFLLQTNARNTPTAAIPPCLEVLTSYRETKLDPVALLRLANMCQLNRTRWELAIDLYLTFLAKYPIRAKVLHVPKSVVSSYRQVSPFWGEIEFPDIHSGSSEQENRILATLVEHHTAIGRVEGGSGTEEDKITASYWKNRNNINRLKQLIEENPESLSIPKILFRIGFLEEEAEKITEARETFQQIIDDYPESDFAPRSQHALAIISKRDEEKEEEKWQAYQKLLILYPDHTLNLLILKGIADSRN